MISSPTTRLANTAPGLNSNSRDSWSKIDTPVTSLGSRSGVNWMRRTEQSMRAGQRLGEHRLADAGHVLDEQVALGEQHDQRQPDDVGLALDDLLDVVRDARWRTSRSVVQAGRCRCSWCGVPPEVLLCSGAGRARGARHDPATERPAGQPGRSQARAATDRRPARRSLSRVRRAALPQRFLRARPDASGRARARRCPPPRPTAADLRRRRRRLPLKARGVVDGGGKWSSVGDQGAQGARPCDRATDGRSVRGTRVPRDPHPAARREGPADPAGEVPGPAGGGRRDHQGAGALPVRLHRCRLRRPGRASRSAPTTEGRARLPPHLLRQRLRRGPRPAGPRHRAGRACAATPGSTRTASSSAPTPASRSGTPRPGAPTSRSRSRPSPSRRRSRSPPEPAPPAPTAPHRTGARLARGLRPLRHLAHLPRCQAAERAGTWRQAARRPVRPPRTHSRSRSTP